MKSNWKIFLIVLTLSVTAQVLSSGLPSSFSYTISILNLAGINAILAVSLNLVNGISGQFSLGHAGFMAVGAYTSACLSVFVFPGLPGQFAFILAMSGGAALAALAGYVVGLPSLRLRGDYLAIVTLGFGEIIRVIILNMDNLGGARGFIGIPAESNPFWILLVLLLTIFACVRLMQSTHGRAWLAIREDEVAAEAMGVDTTHYKVLAFTLSAGAAGAAGALFAHLQSYINPESFDFMKSVDIVIMVVLGGMGSMSGSLIAAVILTLLPEALRPLAHLIGVDLRLVIYSLALILLMTLRPSGLLGRKEIWNLRGKR
jgi:branched-chain amino acid transport system permease protein